MASSGALLRDGSGAIYAISGDDLARFEIDGESRDKAEDYLESDEVAGFELKPTGPLGLVDVELQMIFGSPIQYKTVTGR